MTRKRNLKEIVKVLKGTGAALIWASTTPVPEGVRGRKNEEVIAYNAVARRLMAANGIPVDDLYSFALPQLNRIQRPGNVHFAAEGSRVPGAKGGRCGPGGAGPQEQELTSGGRVLRCLSKMAVPCSLSRSAQPTTTVLGPLIAMEYETAFGARCYTPRHLPTESRQRSY